MKKLQYTAALCLTLLCLAVLVGCDNEAPADTAVKQVQVTDLDRMQGTWQGTEAGGNENWTLTIDGNALTLDGPGAADYAGTLTLDETTDPKSAVMTIETCSYEGYVGTTANSIYRLEGDTLTLAGTEPGSGTRPAAFVSDGATRVFTLKKIQPQ